MGLLPDEKLRVPVFRKRRDHSTSMIHIMMETVCARKGAKSEKTDKSASTLQEHCKLEVAIGAESANVSDVIKRI